MIQIQCLTNLCAYCVWEDAYNTLVICCMLKMFSNKVVGCQGRRFCKVCLMFWHACSGRYTCQAGASEWLMGQQHLEIEGNTVRDTGSAHVYTI